MLDKLPIGEPLKDRKLKCEKCGFWFCEGNANEANDYLCLDENGLCLICNEELVN